MLGVESSSIETFTLWFYNILDMLLFLLLSNLNESIGAILLVLIKALFVRKVFQKYFCDAILFLNLSWL